MLETKVGNDQGMLAKIPLRRLDENESDIGRVEVFLASEDSDDIIGQTIMVDGCSIKLRSYIKSEFLLVVKK